MELRDMPDNSHPIGALPETGYVRQSQLIPVIFPFSSATLWRKVKAGTFPKPVKLGPRITAWRVQDIRSLIEKVGQFQSSTTTDYRSVRRLGSRSSGHLVRAVVRPADGACAPSGRAGEPREGLAMNGPIDFAEINRAALAAFPAVLARILPGGKRVGAEIVELNPRRADSRLGSFKVNRYNGRWADFATGDKGGDPISLVAYLADVSQGEAARLLARMLDLEGRRASR
jgi:Prophage CP4-57 regulatory protein (AlpA)